LDPKYIKAYYRRGSAYYALDKLKLALKDFKAVVQILPKDPDAQKKFTECDKAYRQELFLKAIEMEEAAAPPLDIDAIVIDQSYDGPELVINEHKKAVVTVDFVKAMIERFQNLKTIHRKHVLMILTAAIEHFRAQPSLMRLSLPRNESGAVIGTFTVCGDTHGQFFDLCNIFTLGGFPSSSNRFLFNGDFVDRGSWGFETVMTLICIKLACPDALFMSRGNHETK
jgi:serine/threonine-protein phosphatase 5